MTVGQQDSIIIGCQDCKTVVQQDNKYRILRQCEMVEQQDNKTVGCQDSETVRQYDIQGNGTVLILMTVLMPACMGHIPDSKQYCMYRHDTETEHGIALIKWVYMYKG